VIGRIGCCAWVVEQKNPKEAAIKNKKEIRGISEKDFKE
jgi:hypothetical protein